jgi:hypothetical protein
VELKDVVKVSLEYFLHGRAIFEKLIVLPKARNDLADFNISVKQTLKDIDSGASHLARPVSFSFQIID